MMDVMMQAMYLSTVFKLVLTFTSFILILLPKSHAMDVKPQKEKFTPNYSFYHNITGLERKIKALSNRYPDWMKVDLNYKSRNDRPQFLIHVTDFKEKLIQAKDIKTEKLKVLFSYGEHAREFLPTESMLYLIDNITTGITTSLKGTSEWLFSKNILTNVDLYLIAMANPDGRKYIELSQNYCWRGTSTGVDLERNFDWQFGGKGSSGSKSDEEYRGKKPFSEPETIIFTDITDSVDFDIFVSFHSGINQIYIPFADSKSQRTHSKPDNVEAMEDLAFHLSRATKFKHKYGNAFKLSKYAADGTIFDYMAGVKKIPFSYTIELWGLNHKGPSCFDLFNPRSEDLQTVLKDIHPLYASLFTYLIEWKSNDSLTKMDTSSYTYGYIFIFVFVLIVIIALTQSRYLNCVRFYQRRRIVSLRSLSSTFSLSLNKNI